MAPGRPPSSTRPRTPVRRQSRLAKNARIPKSCAKGKNLRQQRRIDKAHEDTHEPLASGLKLLAEPACALHAFGVHLVRLKLRDFRNYRRLEAEFSAGLHLMLGDNAQGKTNILEAIYLMATLRSFRGVGSAPMVRHGQTGYFVGAKVVSQGEHEIRMYWSPRERKLTLDGQP